MSKPTKVSTVNGVREHSMNTPNAYWFPSPMDGKVIQWCRFFVPGMVDELVVIDAVHIVERGPNALRHPISLKTLNKQLEEFQWPLDRVKFLVCTASSPLCAEVEHTVEKPYWQQNLNRAVRDWRHHHPSFSIDSFIEDARAAWNTPPEED
jgi:hypothetical protein